MPNVLPDPPGLDIDTVIYSYRIRKDTEDHVDVYVGNEDAAGTGYIFREHDEWRPGSLDGTEINKVVGIGGINRSLWGDGFIDVEGNGSVEDPNLIYTYRVDPCYNPQFDPNCPGYEIPQVEIPEVSYEIYDAMEEVQVETVDLALIRNENQGLTEEELKKKEEEEEEERKRRLEAALSSSGAALEFANAFAADQMIKSMNSATNVNAYYSSSIPGGSYSDTVQLVDTQLPENKQGLRNGLAQQLLHQQMIDSQYN
jgi:hypothetical protein